MLTRVLQGPNIRRERTAGPCLVIHEHLECCDLTWPAQHTAPPARSASRCRKKPPWTSSHRQEPPYIVVPVPEVAAATAIRGWQDLNILKPLQEQSHHNSEATPRQLALVALLLLQSQADFGTLVLCFKGCGRGLACSRRLAGGGGVRELALTS